MSEQQAREQFEAWARKNGFDVNATFNALQVDQFLATEHAWQGWQAALSSMSAERDALIEQARLESYWKGFDDAKGGLSGLSEQNLAERDALRKALADVHAKIERAWDYGFTNGTFAEILLTIHAALSGKQSEVKPAPNFKCVDCGWVGAVDPQKPECLNCFCESWGVEVKP